MMWLAGALLAIAAGLAWLRARARERSGIPDPGQMRALLERVRAGNETAGWLWLRGATYAYFCRAGLTHAQALAEIESIPWDRVHVEIIREAANV